MTDSEDSAGGFLSGWSRRKLAAKRQEAEPAPSVEAEPPLPEVAPEEFIDAELVAALPSLDEITAGFDIKPFLAKGVPASLKNAAMRRLWSANPSVRDYVDPAMDYAWDWNAPGGVPGGGGVLTEESVAKMVRDLIGKGPDAQAETPDDPLPEVTQAQIGEGQDLPVPEVGEPEAALDDAPPDPVRRTDVKTVPKDETIAKSAPHDGTKVTQRRHGGAAPQ